MTIERFHVGPRMSGAVKTAGLVFTAGQVADNTNQDVAGQTREVLAKIDALLAAAGTDKSKLVSASIWLSDISTFQQMNSVWDAWVLPGHTPARATVEAKLAAPAYTVEIAVVAGA